MTPVGWVVMVLVTVGLVFFAGGTLGLLRFPDVYNRLHALTKADNVGLGFVVVGLAIHDGTWSSALKHLLVWVLVLIASTTACHLIARNALHEGVAPWRKT